MLLRFSLCLLVLGLGLAACAEMGSKSGSGGLSFDRFYAKFRAQVAQQGLDPKVLDAAFDGKPAPLRVVLEHEQTQPETTKTILQYFEITLSTARQAKGRELATKYKTELASASVQSGVPPEILIALWGIESNYGQNMGDHRTVPALVTLAWKSPRGSYFAGEAMAALRVAKRENMLVGNLVGSWAGAMGQCQFMPTNYLKHARDGNGDGKVDIWGTEADVFASSGNFLKHLGWKTPPGGPSLWRLPAMTTFELPAQVKFNDRGLSDKHTIAQWQKWGVVPKGLPFSKLGEPFALTRVFQPLGNRGPTYMLSPNFDVVLGWNMSSYFAASVFLLGDSIRDGELPDV